MESPAEIATPVIVSTDEFWEKMCSPKCIRTNLRQCVIERTVYVTTKAPEEVPGFIEARIHRTRESLKDHRPTWLRWLIP